MKMKSWHSKAAVHALDAKTGDLLAPLIEVDDESSASSDESSQYSASTVSVQVKPTFFNVIKTTIGTLCLLVFSILLSNCHAQLQHPHTLQHNIYSFTRPYMWGRGVGISNSIYSNSCSNCDGLRYFYASTILCV